MKKTWTEDEITLDCLATHIADSGLECVTETQQIVLHTHSGIGYLLSLERERKFVRFVTYLPAAREAMRWRKRDFEHRLNSEVFMGSFWIDGEDDLVAEYLMSYRLGLIAGQFMAILHRYASMLEHVMAAKNDEGLVAFGQTPHLTGDDDVRIANLRLLG
ncbi:hypothetical protein AWB74_01938 [Caballeronia arvi]|uniref:Sensory transduction regulator n=1 Tax=Caballeronia arvi TaxID=1777135 RepID=A0A158HMF8_9BURK|nr:YbjN domain-containing protein [Caballeronia arvi]SAL45189.1 hypothetical protein AWB74_01938 [Caballeronia arvi]